MWIKGAWRAVNATTNDDILLCYLDIQAVICWWIAILTCRKRNIVAINILLKDKPTLKNRVASWLYKRALSSKRFHATVTSPEYGKWLNRKFRRDFSYYHLPDLYVYDDLADIAATTPVEPDTVFCGGKNGRDWQMMADIAKAMPEMRFKLIMPGEVWNAIGASLPPNVTCRHDIPVDEFLHDMASSEVVCLPLDTEAPAGLIVLFQAAAMNKPIVTSDTVTTRGYITDKISNARLVASKNPLKWADTIRRSTSCKTSSGHSLRNYLRDCLKISAK
ncbi:glycosyltransferase [Muribaculum intestinale]|uniref:glycosyltransferase n=1 Tax=Muribaculum intestinale TaxID=1796646 RepID=UPI00242BF693|nr:glycosyltransferase [Muribaculum intestinale]